MNILQITKIVGAVLAAVLTMTVIGFVGNIVLPEDTGDSSVGGGHEAAAPAPAKAEAPAAAAPQAPAAAAPQAQTAAKGGASIGERLARADIEAGAKAAKKCLGCHSMAKSRPNKVGPGLWEIVGRPKGSAAGYRYSAGMAAKGGEWSYADLDAFLADPKAFVAKTKMTVKVKKPEDRAAVILFLRALAEAPAPLPGQ